MAAQIDGPVAFVGHSYGGAISMVAGVADNGAFAEHPEKLYWTPASGRVTSR